MATLKSPEEFVRKLLGRWLFAGGAHGLGAGAAEAGKELVGVGDIEGDLVLEFVGVSEFLLRTKALPEANLDGLGSEVAGIIEEMSFDAEAGSIEGGANADIGDAAMAAGFAVEDGAGNVHAASGEQFLFGLEVKGGEGEFPTGAGAADHLTRESKGTAQKAGSMAHIAVGDQSADQGAGNDLGIAHNRRVHHDFETLTHAQLFEEFNVARLLVTEMEVIADNYGTDLELVD